MTDKGPKNTAKNAASQETPAAKDQRTGEGTDGAAIAMKERKQ